MDKDRMTWRKARKKPLVVEYREVDGATEAIRTKEGTMTAVRGWHYVIRGVRGELYPIEKRIFTDTYEIIEERPKNLKRDEIIIGACTGPHEYVKDVDGAKYCRVCGFCFFDWYRRRS